MTVFLGKSEKGTGVRGISDAGGVGVAGENITGIGVTEVGGRLAGFFFQGNVKLLATSD
jgi:hypothetical protein